MSKAIAMNTNMAAAARFAAAFDACSAAMLNIILDAIFVASIIIVRNLPVVLVQAVVLVLVLVLVRISLGLVARFAENRHKAVSQT